jgi:RNA polymerase sigma factor (TIGR02999 family)
MRASEGDFYWRAFAFPVAGTSVLDSHSARMPSVTSDLTLLLNRISSGNIPAEDLLPLVYQELRHVAAQKMRGQSPGHTLQATALVHEAWLRVGAEAHEWQNRAHFFGAAAEAMRRILIDRARSKAAIRHGGGLERVDLDDVEIAMPAEESEMLDVHESLDEFARHHPGKAELVKLRYFAGLTIEEAAEVLGISTPTAKRHWAFAKMWLFTEISRKRKPDV